MKRIVIGTWYECNKVLKQNTELGDAGYDYYAVTEVTDFAEIEHLVQNSTLDKKVLFQHRSIDKLKQFIGSGNLAMIEMFYDDSDRKSEDAYNNAMKVL